MTTHSGRSTRAGAHLRIAAAAVLLPVIGACAPDVSLQRDTPAPSPAYTAFEETGQGWWRVYFQMAWDQEEQPNWHADVHHLNAVFGYQLLIIRETNLKRF